MTNSPKQSLAFALLATCIAACFLLPSLGRELLWEDEAETALLARSILVHGYPCPWDGEHLITQQGGRDFVWLGDKLVWTWHPWLQHYLTAASFALFGEGTTQARLPFALVGLLTVPVFFFWRAKATDPRRAMVATLILVLSVTFLLFSRQCRYYPLLFLSGALVFWQYEGLGQLLDAKPRGGWIKLGLALGLMFWANTLSATLVVSGLLLHSLLMLRTNRALFGGLLKSLVLLGLLASPWLWLMAQANVGTSYMTSADRLLLLFSQTWRFHYMILPALLWLPLWWYWWKGRKPESEVAPLLRFETGLLTLLAVVGIVITSAIAPLGGVRYLLPLLPLGLACAEGLWAKWQPRRTGWAAAFVAILTLTNLFAALPVMPCWLSNATAAQFQVGYSELDRMGVLGRPNSPIADYLLELGQPNPGPVTTMVEALRQLPVKPRLVLTNYAWEPLRFYLNLPAGLHQGEPEGRLLAKAPPFDFNQVDMVIPRAGWGELPIKVEGDPAWQEFVVGPDYQFENIPDPTSHRYYAHEAPLLKVYIKKELLQGP